MSLNPNPATSKGALLCYLKTKCYDAGIRKTLLLTIVLEILVYAEADLTIAQMHVLACKIKGSFALTSVYRIIHKLLEFNLVESHQFNSTQSSYKLHGKDPHDHLIDMSNGKIIEFRNQTLDKVKHEIAEEFGYQNVNCRVEVYIDPFKESSLTRVEKYNREH